MHNRAVIALAALAACSSQSVIRGGSGDRAGLGTRWGETRRSVTHEVPFERASDRPFAQASLFYDDSAGLSGLDREAASFEHRGLETLVVDELGRPLETFRSGDRIYVVGKEGQTYRLRVRNHTGLRVEVVASVDGLDVLDGRRASLTKRGYLVDAYGALDIDGFRRSQAEVAAFRFGPVPESYAARTGDDRNAGVIGFALFDERGARVADPDERVDERDGESERRRMAQPFAVDRFARPPEE
jgi:hypothetical protein